MCKAVLDQESALAVSGRLRNGPCRSLGILVAVALCTGTVSCSLWWGEEDADLVVSADYLENGTWQLEFMRGLEMWDPLAVDGRLAFRAGRMDVSIVGVGGPDSASADTVRFDVRGTYILDKFKLWVLDEDTGITRRFIISKMSTAGSLETLRLNLAPQQYVLRNLSSGFESGWYR